MDIHDLTGLAVLSFSSPSSFETPQSTAENRYCKSFLSGNVDVVLLPDRHNLANLRPYSAKLVSNTVYWYINDRFFFHEPTEFPIPISGVVYPIFIPHELDSENALLESEHLREFCLNIVYYGATPPTRMIIVPITAVQNTPLSSIIRDPDWWRNTFSDYISTIEPSIVEQYALDEQSFDLLDVVVCPMDRLAELPSVIADKFGDGNAGDFSPKLAIPQLKHTPITLADIGIGYRAAEGFVKRVIHHLISQGETFTVWIDAAQRPSNQALQYPLYFDGHKIAVPRKAYTPDGNLISIPAYHPYVEYKGMVFDSCEALSQPIPLAEYQRRLTSAWRDSIHIDANTSLSTAIASVAAKFVQLQQPNPLD